jgi:hypothetical protein
MDDFFSRTLDQIFMRSDGPFHLRFILQPLVSTMIAIRAGLKDAAEHRPPYLWTLVSRRDERGLLIRSGWKDIWTVFLAAFTLDAVYQFVVFQWFYPGQSLVVAIALAIVPYLLLRGPAARLATWRNHHHTVRRDTRSAGNPP